jgi:hypothetical protein
MSVELYSEPYFKGYNVKLDIGKYFDLKEMTIGSIIINDNVELIFNNKLKLCGQQSISKTNGIDNITSISIKHSICNPYTEKNSILNKYSIGKNYSIQFNKDLQEITEEDNKKNGFVDFWYNNQTNKANDYYSITGGHVVPHHYENNDDYSSAVVDLVNYSLYNKWFDKDKYIDSSRKAVYNHLKEKYPLKNTNNITNCKFDCGRESNTFRRNYCEMNCNANGLVGKRMDNNYNKVTRCNKNTDKYYKDNQLYKKMNKNKDKIEHFSDNINSKYGQYHMYPTLNNPNTDEVLVTIYNDKNFEGNFLELKEGYYPIDRFNVFNMIKSIKIKDEATVTLFNDLNGSYPVYYYDKDKKPINVLNGPFEEHDLENKLSDAIVAFCIKKNNKSKLIEGFNNNSNILIIIIIILFGCYVFHTFKK